MSQVLLVSGDSGLPAATRRWLAVSLCLSVAVHFLLLVVIQTTGMFQVTAVEPEVERVFTIESGTISPEEADRIAMVEDTAVGELRATAEVLSDDFPQYRDAGPAEAPMRSRPVPRYPEEELPLLSRAGLSERAQSFVRDGELEAKDPGKERVAYLAGGRVVAPAPVGGADAAPKLRERPEDLAAISGLEPGLPGDGTAPRLSLEPPVFEPAAPRVLVSALGRDAERLMGDRGAAVQAVPMPLDVRIDVYAEAHSQYRFFRMTVAQRADSPLPVIAKNVLFVVDISASIRLDMLNGVRQAVEKASGAFNSGDRFNVVRFSEQSYKMFPAFVSSGRDELVKAARWIEKEPGQVRTDVYTAVKDVIASLDVKEKGANRPTNVYLVTDGNPTTGIQDIRHIVNDLSAVTRSNYSIFAINPGAPDANAYLLDLLAYRNRGDLVMAQSPGAVERELLALLAAHKDPVLMNLQAQYGNFQAAMVYPEALPNLYAGHSVVIHGRCLPGETIAVRIIGDSAKERCKFLYTHTLPEVMTDDESIAREWARGRMHYLSSVLAREGEKREVLEEIRELSERYNLASPYPR